MHVPRCVLGLGSFTLKVFQYRKVQICSKDRLAADEVGKLKERSWPGWEVLPTLGQVADLRGTQSWYCPFAWHTLATRDVFKPVAYDFESIRDLQRYFSAGSFQV